MLKNTYTKKIPRGKNSNSDLNIGIFFGIWNVWRLGIFPSDGERCVAGTGNLGRLAHGAARVQGKKSQTPMLKTAKKIPRGEKIQIPT